MVLQVSNANNVKIYTVSGGLGSRSIPDWLARKKKKTLKKDLGKLDSLTQALPPCCLATKPSVLSRRVQSENRVDSRL
jgi:hypothetical protein